MAKPRSATPKPSPKTQRKKQKTAIPHGRLNTPELVKVLLTVEEAAHKLSIGRTACYRLIKCGDLRSILVGSARRVPVEAVNEFVERAMARAHVA